MTLKRIISDETQCVHCIHAEVCRKTMASWCQNFDTNGVNLPSRQDCDCCIHVDERHPPEGVAPIKCWSCSKFISATRGK